MFMFPSLISCPLWCFISPHNFSLLLTFLSFHHCSVTMKASRLLIRCHFYLFVMFAFWMGNRHNIWITWTNPCNRWHIEWIRRIPPVWMMLHKAWILLSNLCALRSNGWIMLSNLLTLWRSGWIMIFWWILYMCYFHYGCIWSCFYLSNTCIIKPPGSSYMCKIVTVKWIFPPVRHFCSVAFQRGPMDTFQVLFGGIPLCLPVWLIDRSATFVYTLPVGSAQVLIILSIASINYTKSSCLPSWSLQHVAMIICILIFFTALRAAFAYPFGSTDLCQSAVHMEPFSTSVFKVLIWIFALSSASWFIYVYNHNNLSQLLAHHVLLQRLVAKVLI